MLECVGRVIGSTPGPIERQRPEPAAKNAPQPCGVGWRKFMRRVGSSGTAHLPIVAIERRCQVPGGNTLCHPRHASAYVFEQPKSPAFFPSEEVVHRQRERQRRQMGEYLG